MYRFVNKLLLKKFFFCALVCVLIGSKNFVNATENMVTDGPTVNDIDLTTDLPPTSPQVPTQSATTPKPKVPVRDSDLCKRCNCDFNTFVLDCSNKNWTEWFSDNEWNTLQNGDVTFSVVKLDHNKLTEIPALPPNSIKSLYLGFNQIKTIEKAAFQNTSQLEKLDLSHNELTSKDLDPDVFKGTYSPNDYQPLNNLKELDLGYNKLHNLQQDLFEHLPNLETLILCKNEFQVIDQQTEIAISGLLSLKTLDLSYMELSQLPETFPHGPRDLEVLILTGNLFHELPKSLKFAVNLKQLVLDENPFGNVSQAFPELEHLEYLSLSYINDLVEISSGTFSNLQNLNTLVLVGNPNLERIDAQAFAQKTVDPTIFDYPPLEALYLNNNNLTSLNQDLLHRWDKILAIDLRFNPWSCDCSNYWLAEILLPRFEKDKPQMLADVTCARPDRLKNLVLLDSKVNEELTECVRKDTEGGSSAVWAGVLVAILVSIPIIIAGYVVYRRNGFNFLHCNRGRRDSRRALYNRPMFEDDFHI